MITHHAGIHIVSTIVRYVWVYSYDIQKLIYFNKTSEFNNNFLSNGNIYNGNV